MRKVVGYVFVLVAVIVVAVVYYNSRRPEPPGKPGITSPKPEPAVKPPEASPRKSEATVKVPEIRSVRFEPVVRLPELDAGKPLTDWLGIIVTCMPGAQFRLNGRIVDRNNAVRELRNLLETLEPCFKEFRKKLPEDYHAAKVSFVPVLVCISREAAIQSLFDTLDILYQARCTRLHIAVETPDGFGALSLCTLLRSGQTSESSCGGYTADNRDWIFLQRYELLEINSAPLNAQGKHWQFFWREEISGAERSCQNIFSSAGKKGKFSHSSCHILPGPISKPIIVLGEEVEITKDIPRGTSFNGLSRPGQRDYPDDNIEPLFDLIERHKKKDSIVILNYRKCAGDLTWQWLVNLLARLEKTNIKGYAFAAPEGK